MRAGDLRHPIDILRDTRVTDEIGGSTSAPSTFVSLRARKLSDREAERYAGNQVQGFGRVVYEIRYFAGITTAMKARADDQILRIVGIEDPDNGRKRRLHLVCERRAVDAA